MDQKVVELSSTASLLLVVWFFRGVNLISIIVNALGFK